jgi:isochorismate synthase
LKPFATKDIEATYKTLCLQGLSFAFYQLPDQDQIGYLSGQTVRNIKPEQEAFAFAPFNRKAKPYYIVPNKKSASTNASLQLSDRKITNTPEKRYKSLVKRIIAAVKGKKFEKVVAARALSISAPEEFSPIRFFQTLCKAYPHAFVSLTYIPSAGMWIGATPEVLVRQTKQEVITYSLAGTRRADDKTPWGNKELQEQAVVTRFISKKLHKISTKPVQQTGPVTRQAGTLKHLLTVFKIAKEEPGKWAEVVKVLHPTPAVSGLPQAKAATFIKAHESFDRSFYAGYLGPVNLAHETNLYVNLRCMEGHKLNSYFMPAVA